MQRVAFTTSQPYDHVQRALDTLRKMHFDLQSLAVDQHGPRYSVIITFECRGDLSADVFVNRLSQLDGLDLVAGHVAAWANSSADSEKRPPFQFGCSNERERTHEL